LDRDRAAVAAAADRLQGLPVVVVQASYADLPRVLAERGWGPVDGILLDLGMSSDQLADPERGFSFQAPGPLDLRFDREEGEPAWQWLNRLSERELADLIYRYGEERFSRRIARAIVARRQPGHVWTAAELADLVRRCVGRRRERIDPATRTFQALRIAVNDELGHLARALAVLPDCLRPGGRLAILSFHSLEDRLVKEAFRRDPRLEVLTKKPIRPSPDEVAENPRSRSARLRVARRQAAG
jgi:16S rRNA (cytosine1402-N4)-methyltransferase